MLRVAEAFGTPTYVYIEDHVRTACRQLRHHLADVPTRLLYAMKANPQPALLRIFQEEGLGLDVVSPGEALLALRLGFSPEALLYTANNMTDDEMHRVQALGLLLNIGEADRLERYGQAYPGSRVCIRINPDVGAGHHAHVVTGGKKAKFGIPLDQMDAVRTIAAHDQLKIVGLHQHIGSGIADAAQFRAAMQVLLRATSGFPDLEFLNFGGGLNVPYRPGDAPIDFVNFRAQIVEPLQAFHAAHPQPLTFWFEPGRFLVAEAGVLLVRVNTLKTIGDRTFAGTDSGFNHLIRPILYGAYHGIYNLSNPDGPLQSYDVVGNICESGDLFARDRTLQEVRTGDVLAILDTGAYSMAMASTYNLRPLPAEVLIHPNDTPALIRPRLSDEAWVEQMLAGPWANEHW